MKSMYLHQVQRCLVCGGETIKDVTTLEYDFGDFKITVTGVPAAVCQHCGESYVPGNIGVVVGDAVARLADEVRRIAKEEAELKPERFEVAFAEQLMSSRRDTNMWATA